MNENCPHCGKKMKRPTASFCTNCGTPLNAASGEAIATVHGGMLAKIIVHIPGEETHEEFLSKAVTTLGRSRANMIQVPSPFVSGKHAQIDLTAAGHTVTDLNSTNGTFVNGGRLIPLEAHLLASNDIIRFSDSLGNSASLTYIAPSDFSEIDDVDISGTFQLTNPVSYIGRNPTAAISLDHPAVSWNHARIIKNYEKRDMIQDLSSNNGTFLNGTQLPEHRMTPLTRGDVVQIGPFNLVYQGTGNFVPFSAERNFRLEAVDIEKTYYATNFLGFKDKNRPNTVLNHFNLVINPREFVAIVGGSGTGKSTLIKSISGVSRATSGTVLVNGDDLYSNFNLYRTMMGYVPQDDIIHQGLEVEQALCYAARLRLPDASTSEIEHRITEVLGKVGMSEQAGLMVRDLSGGQRKRVSIAVELLAEPWIFFLDEPTSGLDPGLEKLMMDTLRQLADEGRTIVMVTHATSNIMNNCDQVTFLGQGGKLAFFGPPAEATAFFSVANFADIYTRLSQSYSPDEEKMVPETIRPEFDALITGAQADSNSKPECHVQASLVWAEHYRSSAACQTYITNRQSGEVSRPISGARLSPDVSLAGQARQFTVLAQRYLRLIRHDRMSLWLLLAAMPIIGLFLLLITDGAALVGNTPAEIATIVETTGVYAIVTRTQTLLFMMALSITLLGIFAASFEVVKEEPIYRRERMINLKILPYLSSKFVVLGAFVFIQCFLLLLVLGLGLIFPGTGAILWAPPEYYVTLVLTGLASVALGLCLSALASSRDMVIYLVLIVVFLQIVFSGAIFELSPAARPLSWLTITRWSLEALGASTDMDTLNNLGQVRVERDVDLGRSVQTVTEDIATTVDFNVNFSHNAPALISRWIFLVVQIVLWGSLALWLIKRKDEL
jgi:ABC-type multidrug transport system ATPase subunit